MRARQQIGPYRLDAVLGTGAASTVWRARRRGSVHQAVALKLVEHGAGPSAADRLRAEAEVLAGLDHPHIVRILDVIDDASGLAVVMPLAVGGSLADLLEHRGPVEPGGLVALLAPVAGALDSAHRRGLVHGDVKPANLLLSSDGEALLADFGMARLATPDGRPLGGTDAYAAPEVRAGAGPAGTPADVWSLGATAIEALLGAPPGPGGCTPGDLLAARPEVGADLADLLAAMVAPTPGARPAAADVGGRLRAAVPAAEVALPPPLPPEALGGAAARPPTRAFGQAPPERSRRRVPRRAVATLAGALVGAAVLVLLLSTGGDQACPEVDLAALAAGGAQVAAADVDGSGCDAAVAYGADPATGDMVLEVWAAGERLHRLGLGRPGDRMLLGDWDCDDVHTAALYRPADGTLLVFDRWPDGGEALEPADRRQLVADGDPRVRQDDDGCDVVAIGDDA